MAEEPTALGIDERTAGERLAWRLLGPPLYYCECCLRRVRVIDGEVVRDCEHDLARVIAPRRAIVAGEGGLTPANRVRQAFQQTAAKLTGRSV